MSAVPTWFVLEWLKRARAADVRVYSPSRADRLLLRVWLRLFGGRQ